MMENFSLADKIFSISENNFSSFSATPPAAQRARGCEAKLRSLFSYGSKGLSA
jgi:hypothetical protein